MSQNKRHHTSSLPPGRVFYVLLSFFFRNRGWADGDPWCLQAGAPFSTPSVSRSQATWPQGRCRSSVQLPRHAEEFGGDLVDQACCWGSVGRLGRQQGAWRSGGGKAQREARRGGAVFSHQLEDCSRHAQALRRFCVREFCRRRDPCEGGRAPRGERPRVTRAAGRIITTWPGHCFALLPGASRSEGGLLGMREDTGFLQCLLSTPLGEGRGEEAVPTPRERAKISTLASLSFFCLERGRSLPWSWLETF